MAVVFGGDVKEPSGSVTPAGCRCSWYVRVTMAWERSSFVYLACLPALALAFPHGCQCALHSMLFVLVHLFLGVDLSEPGSFDILWCSYFYWCHLVGARLDWHLMLLFIFLFMLTCRSPARLTFYGVHIFLYVILSEPGSIDILCFRFQGAKQWNVRKGARDDCKNSTDLNQTQDLQLQNGFQRCLLTWR